MSTPETDLATRFSEAWADLATRIRGGIDTLGAMLEDRPGDARLVAKVEGLKEALYLHESIDRDFDPDTGFPGGVHAYYWRLFTSRAFSTYSIEMSGGRAARASGLATALEYQRGYGSDIDAPGLDVLMLRNRE